jgi:hypothetical protein
MPYPFSLLTVCSFVPPPFRLYYRIQAVYIASSREMKRLDSLAFSPIFQHFNESLQGLTTLRAFGKQGMFMQMNRVGGWHQGWGSVISPPVRLLHY